MNDRNFREELLGLQQTDPELRAECDRRVREMMEVQLRPVPRAVWTASTILSALLFVGFAVAAAWSIGRLPWGASAALGTGSVFGAGLAVLGVSVLRKGRIARNRDANTATFLVWAFSIIQFILFFQAAMIFKGTPNTYVGTWMMLSSLGYLLMGVAFLLGNKIDQAALKTEEQFLRLQLRMEQLAAGQTGDKS
jgi:hypothetical protein